jgi:heat shock protein HtpX
MQHLKVFGLMAGLSVVLVTFGALLGGQQGAILFFAFAAIMNFGSYWFSDRVVLRMYKAQIVGREDAPQLYDMVDRLRQRAGLPMPVVAISAQQQPNAFATGRSPDKAVVCFTRGILQALPPKELEGVVAHELAHIQHRHMLVGTVAATLAGAVAMIASIARWGLILGGGRDDDNNPFAVLVMAIVAPIAAMIIQMAISRQNEFQADRTGGEIVGDPMALAGALQRLEGYARKVPMAVNPAAAQLAIVNPFSGQRRGGLTKLFRTHPPTEERVAALQQQATELRSGGGSGRIA